MPKMPGILTRCKRVLLVFFDWESRTIEFGFEFEFELDFELDFELGFELEFELKLTIKINPPPPKKK